MESCELSVDCEDAPDTIESAGDDIWPTNEEYNDTVARAAIHTYIARRWRLSPDWTYQLE